MGYKFYNPNPDDKFVGDCVIRAVSKITRQSWEETYLGVSMLGLVMHDMPSSDNVWGEYLYRRGYRKHVIPDTCPYCYTVREFAYEHPSGLYLLKTSGHVIAVVNGDYYDTSDSGNEVPIYYWAKGEE